MHEDANPWFCALAGHFGPCVLNGSRHHVLKWELGDGNLEVLGPVPDPDPALTELRDWCAFPKSLPGLGAVSPWNRPGLSHRLFQSFSHTFLQLLEWISYGSLHYNVKNDGRYQNCKNKTNKTEKQKSWQTRTTLKVYSSQHHVQLLIIWRPEHHRRKCLRPHNACDVI